MSKRIYEILQQVSGRRVLFAIGEVGTKGNLTLEPRDDKGRIVPDIVPILEITPEGKLVPNTLDGDNRTAIELLQDATLPL